MSVIISKLSDDSIILSTLSLPLHLVPGEIKRLNQEIAHMAATSRTPVYHICKIKETEPLSFSDILLWIAEQQEYLPGSIHDQRVFTILVGEGPLFDLWQKKVRQRIGMNIPVFATAAEAFVYARSRLLLPNDPLSKSGDYPTSHLQ
jgi:hypothetical protein